MAKLHKLGDRLATPQRLQVKDPGDVYRLFDTVAPDELAVTRRTLLGDERSAATTAKALSYLEELFNTGATIGTRLAIDALRGLLSGETVAAATVAYASELRREITS